MLQGLPNNYKFQGIVKVRLTTMFHFDTSFVLAIQVFKKNKNMSCQLIKIRY